MTTPAAPTITTLLFPLAPSVPIDLTQQTEAVVLVHADLPSAVFYAYVNRDRGTACFVRGLPVLLDRGVKGAAATWDALVKEDEARADAAALEATERAELARLQAKYGVPA